MTTNKAKSLRNAQQAIESQTWQHLHTDIVNTAERYAVAQYRRPDGLIETISFNCEGIVIARAS